MDSIKNLKDFKHYVHRSNLNSEEVVFDLLGFVIANNSKSMFDHLVNEAISEDMKDLVKETLESSGDGVYREWADGIKFSSAKTSIDLTGDTSIDDDPVEKAFGDDTLDKLVDDVLEEDAPTPKPKPVATYAFAPDYDSYYAGGASDSVSDNTSDSASDGTSEGSSSDDEFVKELEKSLNI